MKNSVITHKATTKSILDLQNLFKLRHLNLEPGFQRQSVWTERDRSKLIDSILRNYPLPAIFLYKREEKGHLVFDVIDGKQRLESIFMFMGSMRGRFWSRTQLPNSDAVDWIDWNHLKRKGLQHLITGYEIPVIEVDGEMGEIIDVFVRINSTGKALTQQEKRHARYYDSPFLKEAARLGRRFEDQLFEVEVLLYMTRGKRHDIHDVDNRLKDILDALQGKFRGSGKARPLIKNDNRICKAIIEKRPTPKLFKNKKENAGGRIIIRPYRKSVE
jgi:uncharacterized protein with ParB-like and HNH nuclease domain